ncbi:MAG: inorganic phosphate transporter [Saprospiraceae bacterium]
MPDLYLIIVILLFFLAASDLVVGVSNDAVNFLNSAIGSKVATRRTIMIVASLGIFIGSTFSSGMMEIARKGIFNPEFFFFSEIMIVFIAVMLTDILLLDLFNTFGLPTSTTVSIVFEILGAAVAVAVLKISSNGEGLGALPSYINSSSAITIISGIFISVGVAFVVGTLVMFLSRLLFSFQYEKRKNWVGAIWSGLALAVLTYFLLFKGAKGASFMPPEIVSWITQNTMSLFLGSVVFWTIIMQILQQVFKYNIFTIIVLFGTFSLAMAFAGNDLVNFIGVPIAGFESFRAWSDSGVAAEAFKMDMLTQQIRTNPILLLIAGIVMILTLWFSKKAQSVTETEVNLGRQSDGSERFQPNFLSKAIVRYTRVMSNGLVAVLPESWLNNIEKNFKPVKQKSKKAEKGEKHDPPAFDLIRASVNLTTASALIAFATSLKLPLSTTYVSFMVAMGSSLADRAWGRDSAVYRITGVLMVIGGWFMTAIVAFLVSGLFALLIFKFGAWAIGILVLLVIYSLYKSFMHHRKEFIESQRLKALESEIGSIEGIEFIEDTSKQVSRVLSDVALTYKDTIKGLLNEDLNALKKAKKDLKELNKDTRNFKRQLFGSIKRLDEVNAEVSRLYLLVYDLQQDLVQSTKLIIQECDDYVSNSLSPLNKEQKENLLQFSKMVGSYLANIVAQLDAKQYTNVSEITKEKENLFNEMETLIENQIHGIKAEQLGMRNSMLLFSLHLETKDLISVASSFVDLFNIMQAKTPPNKKFLRGFTA